MEFTEILSHIFLGLVKSIVENCTRFVYFFPFSLLFRNDFCHFQLRTKVGTKCIWMIKNCSRWCCYKKIWYIWVAMSFLPLEKVQSCSLNVVFKYWFTKPRSFALLTLWRTGEDSGKVAAWYLFTSWNLWLTHWVMQKQNKLNSQGWSLSNLAQVTIKSFGLQRTYYVCKNASNRFGILWVEFHQNL